MPTHTHIIIIITKGLPLAVALAVVLAVALAVTLAVVLAVALAVALAVTLAVALAVALAVMIVAVEAGGASGRCVGGQCRPDGWVQGGNDRVATVGGERRGR